MAARDGSLTLMGIPLEIRHNIFAMASVREKGTKKVLRHWFEKMDVQNKVAKVLQNDPSAPAPRVLYGDESDEDEDAADPMENEDQASEGEEEVDAEADEDESEDENGEVDNEDSDEGEDDTFDDHEAGEEAAESESADDEIDMETEEPLNVEQDEAEVNNPDVMLGVDHSNANSTAYLGVDEDQDMSDDGETSHGHNEEEAEDGEGSGEEAEASATGNETATTTDDNAQTTAQAAPPRPVTIRPERKWRHIPKLLRISGCPPPPELLLACKEMSREVKDWYFDVTVIRIDVSGSFAHTSMFELALRQIAESPLSPFRNIRKVELMFVWDTEWIRSEAYALAVFPALLKDRVKLVQQVLQDCAKELKQVTVHWHDSINDNESAAFKYEVLDFLDILPVDIKVAEHYLQPGQKPRAKTIAGKKRTEFQNIADSSYGTLS